ncbi:MAG: hybrid sensor histidine kinase/response regulator [Pirellulaceae bacterium]
MLSLLFAGTQMVVDLILGASVVLQLAAAVLAVGLMRVTGNRWSWGLISAGIVMMVARRLLALSGALTGDPPFVTDLTYELAGLIISLFLCMGMAGIAPFFFAARRSADTLRESRQRMEHLDAVLRATRDIDQLAIREKDHDKLLEGTCRSLVDHGAYRHAWIARLDASGRPVSVAHAGLGADLPSLDAYMQRGELTPCARQALSSAEVVVWSGVSQACADCPLWHEDREVRTMAIRLAHGEEVYGVMVVAIAQPFPVDEEEQALFSEAARDVAFVLRSLRMEEERHRVEQGLRLDESRLEALLQLNQMTDAPLKLITDFALEEAVRLTQSEIGYLAFLNEDESVLTMHSWSKSAMAECQIIEKPIVYAVESTGLWGEAVRQRRPVITNDYPAPSPWKKGYPVGHVHVTRHMNAPVFEGGRIVVLAGVGNKEQPYDESDVRQLTLLMQGMWRLLHRKQAEEALQTAHDQLEVRVAERTAELLRARDAAEAASRAKSTFLANMSHEIRTPLNAVIGMTELVLKSDLAAQQREYLTTVRDSGEALLSIINDVLDFSKIEAGKLRLDPSPFDLRESLGDTLKSFALRAHQKGLELISFVHADVPRRVVGDYSRLRQVIVNLVGNALKFTEQGEIALEVWREVHSSSEVVLHLTVSDTGIGIAADKQAAVFEMFEQADGSTTRRYGGTGLGLAIASRLLQLMDGRIWVESEAGRGSRFHVTVKLGLAAEEPAKPVSPEPVELHGLRVLVVDDNATNRRILEEVLLSWQMVPRTAPSGAEALKLLHAAQAAGEPFGLVLSDVHMPHMDGLTLAEQIRQDPDARHTVIIMLTSGDRPEDLVACEKLGIGAHLLKPFKQSELLDAIQLALGLDVSRRPAVPTTHLPPVRSLRILLAEDSLVNQKLAIALLQEQGHHVTVAHNGREAVAAFEAERFDVILMDVQMPEMDGLEATAAIRRREASTGRRVPIVAMTAYALKGDRERCLQAGMDGYVAKPIRAQELLDTVARLFAERSHARQP